MQKTLFTTLIFLFLVHIAQSQELTSREILSRSIAYHDPNGEWATFQATLTFNETRPNGPDRKTVAEFDNDKSFFRLNRNDKEIYRIEGDKCVVEQGEGTCERGFTMRNYYLYLWGLPMKLNDPGTQLDETFTETSLEDVPCYVLRVPYEQDVWYYYIRKSDFAMVAYKFYKDESTGKGELIPTDGIYTVGGIKMPNNRTWYELPGKRVLGTDIVVDAQ